MTDQFNEELEKKLDTTMPEKVKSQAEIYDDEIQQLKEDLEKENDAEKLKKDCEVLNEEINAFEKELSEKIYELPEKTTFKGTQYSRSKIFEFIADILANNEVAWQAVLSMYEFVGWWKQAAKDNLKGIPYQYYDTTLRFLGQIKYKGFENYKKILAINALFGAMHDEYALDLSKYYYLHGKYDAISNRIDAIHAINEPLGEKAE